MESVRCLVMPLDLGWFPSPLFLGAVIQDRRGSVVTMDTVSTSNTNTTQSEPRRQRVRKWFRRNSADVKDNDVAAANKAAADESEGIESRLVKLAAIISGHTL